MAGVSAPDGATTALPDVDLYKRAVSSIADASEGVSAILQDKLGTNLPDYADGISLLSLKNALLLEYMHNVTLLVLCKLHGRSIADSKLVDTLVRDRVYLEKIRPLEVKLKYQIDKLVKKAEDHERLQDERRSGKTRAGASSAGAVGEDEDAIANDPLAFKPNPGAFVTNGQDLSGSEGSDGEDDTARAKASTSTSADGIYRPPRLAPVAYNEPARGKKARAAQPPGNALLREMAASLTHSASNPYVESTSGLSVTPALQSRKAKKLADIERYEEENFTRLFMTKKDAKRRRMDEEDVAMGGTGSREDLMSGSKGVRGKKASGFENEFDDLLSSIGKKRKTGQADGYDALRAMRREKRTPGTTPGGYDELAHVNGVPAAAGTGKKSRFQAAVKRTAQKQRRRGA